MENPKDSAKKLLGLIHEFSKVAGYEINALKLVAFQGTWVTQLVNRLTSAQVMISQLMSSSPVSGPMLTARSLEPTSDSLLLTNSRSVSHSLSQK